MKHSSYFVGPTAWRAIILWESRRSFAFVSGYADCDFIPFWKVQDIVIDEVKHADLMAISLDSITTTIPEYMVRPNRKRNINKPWVTNKSSINNDYSGFFAPKPITEFSQ